MHSNFWSLLNVPIKRLVLDECQVVNKRNGIRHWALKQLLYDAVIILSGTPAYNRWHNFSGFVDFLQGHPFKTHASFLRAFAYMDYDGNYDNPDIEKMRLLQRFLQAITIARPADILKLKGCTRSRCNFKLRDGIAKRVAALCDEYKMHKAIRESDKSADDSIGAKILSFAVKAQLLSIHPMLYDRLDSEDTEYDDELGDEAMAYGFIDKRANNGEARRLWLQQVRNSEDLCE